MNYTANPAPPDAPYLTTPDDRMAALLAAVRAGRESFMAERQVSRDIVEQLRALGVYRAMVGRQFGGDERSPGDFCRLIELIAEADGSTAWVASFGASATYLAALPEPTLRALYANGPDVIFAGGLFPVQPAERVPGGFRVSGRWKFASGCTGADVVGVGIVTSDGQASGLPRFAVMPAQNATVAPNWEVIGLQGTGSHDLVLQDVFVPEEWTFARGAPASVDATTYRYPVLALAAQVLAVVGLGIARAALTDLAAMAVGRVSIIGGASFAERPYFQSELAKAEAELRSARGFFYDATEAVWDTVLAGSRPAPEAVALLRLASTHAARTGAAVSRVACGLAGTGALTIGHSLSRAMCDSLVVAQHAFLNEGTLQSAGQALLGLKSAPGFTE